MLYNYQYIIHKLIQIVDKDSRESRSHLHKKTNMSDHWHNKVRDMPRNVISVASVASELNSQTGCPGLYVLLNTTEGTGQNWNSSYSYRIYYLNLVSYICICCT